MIKIHATRDFSGVESKLKMGIGVEARPILKLMTVKNKKKERKFGSVAYGFKGIDFYVKKHNMCGGNPTVK